VPESTSPPLLQYEVLGPLRVVVGGEERPVAGEKLQGLLARLLLEHGRPVATERLIDDLWGDEPPATARQTLHVHVGRLRRLLSADGPGESPLAKEPSGYVLRLIDGDEVDATRFRRLVQDAQRAQEEGRFAAAAERFREALGLWRGRPFAGVVLDYAESARVELDELRLAALEGRIDADLHLGGAVAVIPELEQLVAKHPHREHLRAQLMLALYATGRQADALRAYSDARRALSEELGLEPGPRLRELEQAILRQDPELVTAPLPAASARPGSRRRAGPIAAVTLAAAAALAVAGVMLATRDDPPRAARVASPRALPNSLVEIDPATNALASVTRVGRAPESIASTENAMWVANVGDRTVARIDLESRQVRIVGGAPVAYQLVSSLSGDVWLSSFEEPLVSLIAERGRIVESIHDLASGPVQVRLPGSAEGLDIGGGFLWITSPSDSGGDDTLTRVDLRTRQVVSSVTVGHLPLFTTFGYGSAWVSNYRGNSISVVRPGSREVETIEVPGGPLGIAAGAGAVWVATFWTKELVRIDPETRRVVRRIPIGDGPLAVAVGAGSVWVTNRDDRTISRIDPHANRVVRTIPLAAPPHGIRFAHGRVWVTTQRCGSPIVHC
jgi:DNA-binding SARP family transcriptional activator/DNA-binding beta-propeller fold protein YncE